ncbi:tape measure protein [Acinetobacter guillouiae]|uniref:tape measure protein n=1 Tax=Acinetobacter guillouiae TaxID=106649 RepID=UPI003C7029F7
MAEQRSTLIIEISSEQAARNARALDRELQSIERTGNYATTSMNSMSVAARQLAGYLAGVVTVGTAIAKMDDWTNLNNRLRLVTTSQKALNVAMQDTFDIAQRSGAAWGGTATIYQKIQYNSEKLGLSQEKVAKITESISKSISNSGSSAQAASAALYQLGQSFDKSSLNGDEFVSMSENAGYLMEVFAKGLGVTRAELKEMSSQGLLTTDKMVQAIEKMSGSIEEDFGKTNFTIGQSFTQLSNAVTKFVGEAGQGSGAASTLSSSIKTLADNLGLIANIAMLGGVAALTKTILTQTAAMKTAIGTSINRRVALLSELQAQAQVTARELSRTAAVAQLRSMQLADAQATMARMTGLQRLAYLQSTVLPLERANTVAIAAHAAATEADTIAQNANNAARSVAARLFSAVGGTVGVLTIGVTALAAGYMYMSGKAAEANRKLQEQAEVAKKAKEELLALKGLEKDDAIDDMTASFKRQNEALTESSSKINMQLNAIEQLYKGNKDVVKVVQDARNGTISMNEAVAKFNELRISKDVYNSIKANTAEFVKNATEAGNSKYKLSLFGIEVELSGRKAQTGALGVDQNSESLDKNKTAAEKAAGAQKKFKESLFDRDFEAKLTRNLLAKGYSPEQVKAMVETAEWARKNGVAISNELYQIRLKTLDIEQQNNKVIEDRNKSEKDRTKEMEAQQKLQAKQAVLLAGNNEQTRNMLRVYQSFRNAGLGDKQARIMTAQVGRENDFRNSDMFGSHKDANNGYTNTGFISWQKGRSTQLMQFLQGQGVLDKNGKIQQSQDALDAMAKFLMQEIATGKSYGKTKNALNDDNLSYRELEKIVGQNFIGWDYNGRKLGKDKASQHLSKQDNYFNQISKILGANPENVMSSIKDLSKFEDEAFKARAKTEEEIKQLQAKYDTEAITRSKAREEAINEATVLGQLDLLPKIKERYDAQDKLAQLQIDEDLNSYKWTENQKLVYTYQTNKLRLDAEGKLSDDVKELAKKTLDEQMLYETQKRLQTNSLGIGQIQLDAQSYVRQKQNPTGFQQDQLDSETINKYRDLQLQYSSQRGDIFTLVDDENARNQLLLDAHEKFLMARKALDDEYAVKRQDVIQNDLQNQLSSLSVLVSGTSSSWSNMTGIIKDQAGEQSGIYKTMFAIQQAFAITSATINAFQAYGQIMASPWYLDFVSKQTAATLVLGMGMANVGMIAAQTIAGFSNGGYTGSGGKYDPAGIVHKGEVVFSQEDIARWGGVGNVEKLRKNGGYSDGGVVGNSYNQGRQYDAISQARANVALQPNITINNYSNETVETSTAPNGDLLVQIGKMMDKKIDDGVDKGIQRNLKQGYPLARAIKNKG